MIAEELLKALIDGDVVRCWNLAKHAQPDMPQPASRAQAEVIMHITRTQMTSIPMPLRLVSHDWLITRGLPSRLPYKDAPKREVVSVAVMVGARSDSEADQERAKALMEAQTQAVKDAQARGVTDTDEMRAIIREARA